MNRNFPKRKHPRLENFNYNSAGAYFVTVCTHNRRRTLAHIVGQRLAPAEAHKTVLGEIAEKQLLQLKERYPYITVEQYVIMPNHIHAIIVFDSDTVKESHRPTLTDIICAYKSLTVKECKENGFEGKLFQTSFYEHIIRGQQDYDEIANYIYTNPSRWFFDELYT